MRGGAKVGRARLRTLGLVAAAVLAVAATVAVFLTDDPQLLRVAVMGAAWAFVLALLATGRRTEPVQAPAGAARDPFRARENEREDRLRREAESELRVEVDTLRQEVAALSDLRQDIAGPGGLRAEVSALAALRGEVAGVAALRGELDRLAGLQADLGQLVEVRAELGRLRTELVEQLSSEMLIERIVMRTQLPRPASNSLEDPATRTLEAVSGWSEEPARELAGGWPEVRLDPLPEIPGSAAVTGSPRRRRRTDELHSAEQLTVERPLPAPREQSAGPEVWPSPPAIPPPAEPSTVQAPAVPSPGEARLAQILAENGARPGSGRRRHRYREDDQTDDVLGRVLGRH